MSTIDGVYDCVAQTPMGRQESVVTIVSNGNSLTGTHVNNLGSIDLQDGTIDGDKVHWTMKMTLPMPMTLTVDGVIEGDNLTAEVVAGVFGKTKMKGVRRP